MRKIYDLRDSYGYNHGITEKNKVIYKYLQILKYYHNIVTFLAVLERQDIINIRCNTSVQKHVLSKSEFSHSGIPLKYIYIQIRRIVNVRKNEKLTKRSRSNFKRERITFTGFYGHLRVVTARQL